MPSFTNVVVFTLACASQGLAHYASYGSSTGYGTGGPSPPSTSSIIPPYANTSSITRGPSTPVTTSSVELTTSTVYTTEIETITKCPPTVTDCPLGSVVTKTIPLYTTTCPVSDHSVPTVTVIPQPPKYYTSTIYITDVYTITSCAPTVTLCPIGAVTSHIYATTTVCPYSEAPVYTPSVPYTTLPTPPVSTIIYSPVPTLSFSTISKGGNSTAPIGTGTGLPPASTPYAIPGVLTSSAGTPPKSQATYTPPPVFEGAAGKMGVSSVLALMVAGTFALLF